MPDPALPNDVAAEELAELNEELFAVKWHLEIALRHWHAYAEGRMQPMNRPIFPERPEDDEKRAMREAYEALGEQL